MMCAVGDLSHQQLPVPPLTLETARGRRGPCLTQLGQPRTRWARSWRLGPSLPSSSRPAGRPDLHVASSGGAQEHTAQIPDRTDGERMGKKGDFWTCNKRLFEMLKMCSSFLSNHRNTYIHIVKL